MFSRLDSLDPQMLLEPNAVVFGGSFDPIHQGHLRVLERLRPLFQRVFLAATTANPWKPELPTPLEDRLAMLKIALAAHFEAGAIEVLEQGYHYVDELVLELRQHLPTTSQLWWAVGEDIAAEVRRWRNFETLSLNIVVARIEPDIHASDIRAGLADPLDCLRGYIAQRQLYASPEDRLTNE